ncbi:acyl-CoA dehydrogenase [Pseudomonas aeruginosa]|nr:acyl-CoA dehydrogenase [Pseudomonas aeruginosa]
MNFTLPDELLALQAKTRDFIAEQVIPLENDPRQDSHGPATPCARIWWPAPARPAC